MTSSHIVTASGTCTFNRKQQMYHKHTVQGQMSSLFPALSYCRPVLLENFDPAVPQIS